ncbi:hypothetical protein [Bosea sp. (in: a-proteobacteria)]|uniref:hypothetical protein n=1 Tax=Bosea sp. (in: a-proteobacteria) TaxID=1871050 RepID=UPI002FC6F0B9
MVQRNLLAISVAAAIVLVVAPQAHAAGFLDDLARALFGRPPPPPAFIMGEPLEMTVKPKRHRVRAASAHARPAAPAIKLDPATDPEWYLRDPTLRKGDILVTHSGVVVFEGRASSQHSAADFASLSEARRISKVQREAIQTAAAGGRSFFANNPPAQLGATVQGAKFEPAAARLQ